MLNPHYPARREAGRDEDLNLEVGTRNVELFPVLRTTGLNLLPFTTLTIGLIDQSTLKVLSVGE